LRIYYIVSSTLELVYIPKNRRITMKKIIKLMVLAICIILIGGSLAGCNLINDFLDELQADDEIEGFEEYIDEADAEDRERREIERPPRQRSQEGPQEPDRRADEREEPSNDELFVSEVQRLARYQFEQFELARTADRLETVLVESLQGGNEDVLLELVLDTWDFTSRLILMQQLDSLEDVGLDSDADIDDITYEIRLEFGLGDDHIVEGWLEEIDENTNAFIIQLLDLEVPRTSIYMAIAYNDSLGIQIFTLEEIEGFSRESGEFMFCFVEVGARGSFYTIDGNRNAFIDAIYDAMVNLTAPGITLQR
jgi:hypothetical protein